MLSDHSETLPGATPLSSNARLVALGFSMHVGKDSIAWPSVPLLARRTGLSESSVTRGFHELESAGWLIVTQRGGGKDSTRRKILTPVTVRGVSQGQGCPSDTPPLSDGQGTPVTVTPELDQELDQELDLSRDEELVRSHLDAHLDHNRDEIRNRIAVRESQFPKMLEVVAEARSLGDDPAQVLEHLWTTGAGDLPFDFPDDGTSLIDRQRERRTAEERYEHVDPPSPHAGPTVRAS